MDSTQAIFSAALQSRGYVKAEAETLATRLATITFKTERTASEQKLLSHFHPVMIEYIRKGA